MKKIYSIGIGIVALAVLIGAGWFFSRPSTSTPTTVQNSLNQVSPMVSGIGQTSGRPVPSDFAEYYNPHYGFSILYPNNLTVAEHNEGGGAITVTFENIGQKTVEGFQIFIVPFIGDKITDARFKQDIPSGVRKNLKNIKVDGATGASFYSTDGILGDTAEVWFIHGGYLFEANTFKEYDTWLSGILSSWKFL